MDTKSQQKIVSRHGPLISSKSTEQVSTKGTFSVEDSGPPSPHSGTVNNFGEVAPGIYRSSFPYPENIDHLKSLGLKTILTLVNTQHSSEFDNYVEENGIRHVRILVPAHKDASIVIPTQIILQIQSIMLDPTNRPMLVHCNKGKHRTGCMVATYRKLQGWSMPAIITEYRKYAGAKVRALDEAYITSFNSSAAEKILQGNEGSYYPLPIHSSLPTPPPSESSIGEDEAESQDGSHVYGMGQILTL